jgi:hypothetical protein
MIFCQIFYFGRIFVKFLRHSHAAESRTLSCLPLPGGPAPRTPVNGPVTRSARQNLHGSVRGYVRRSKLNAGFYPVLSNRFSAFRYDSIPHEKIENSPDYKMPGFPDI